MEENYLCKPRSPPRSDHIDALLWDFLCSLEGILPSLCRSHYSARWDQVSLQIVCLVELSKQCHSPAVCIQRWHPEGSNHRCTPFPTASGKALPPSLHKTLNHLFSLTSATVMDDGSVSMTNIQDRFKDTIRSFPINSGGNLLSKSSSAIVARAKKIQKREMQTHLQPWSPQWSKEPKKRRPVGAFCKLWSSTSLSRRGTAGQI